MQITVKHTFQSSKPDSADSTLVQPSNWNADHNVVAIPDVSSVFGRTGDVVAASGDYNVAQITNAVSVLGNYPDPPWITSLAWAKITGAPATGVSSVFGRTGAVSATTGDYTAAQVTNAVSTAGSYADPPWLTSLNWSKVVSPPAFIVDPLTTKGDLLVRGASANGRLPVGVDGLILMADAASALGIKWVAAGAGFQTPWLTNINGGGFDLSNVANITATTSILSSGNLSASGNIGAGGNINAVGIITAAASISTPLITSVADLIFGVGSGTPERMRITANGNIGIGTTNPQANLTVAKNAVTGPIVAVQNTSGTSANASFRFLNAANQSVWEITGDYVGNGGSELNLVGASSLGSKRIMTFLQDGNVGIGTANPLFPLHVKVGVDQNFAIRTGAAIDIASINDVNSALTPVTFSASVYGLMGGNVGIGTAIPNAKLDVFDIDERRFSVTSYSGFHTAIGLHGPNGANIDLGFYAPTTIWQIRGTAANFTIYDADASHGVTLAQNATSWTAASDERGKNITGEITNALHKVCSLRGVEFNQIGDTLPRVGLLAQEVQKVLPEAIDESNPDKLGIRYTEVIPLLVEAIKELERRTE